MSQNITIIGGGLVGSLLAIYLGDRGHRVTVYEERPDMRRYYISAGKSINMACSTRGWQALDKVGVGEFVRQAALPMNGRMIHDRDGALTYQPYGKEGQAIYSISRGGLNKILMNYAEQVAGVSYKFNQKCMEVDLEKRSIVFADQQNSNMYVKEGDLIFGADGAFSVMRQHMQKVDLFNYSQTYINHSYKELSIPPAPDGGFALDPKALHIWPRGKLMLIALPNPDKSFTCTLFLPQDGEHSFAQLKDLDVLQKFFKEQFPDVLDLMPTLAENFFQNPTSSLCIIRCFPWSYKDHACLIGDAAHAIVPFYGQGMIAGFEDCYVLDQLMDEYGEDWGKIFKAFEASRKPNTDAIGDLAMQNFIEMRDLVGDPIFLVRKKIEQKIQKMYPEKFTSLYTMVSFSNTPYKEALEKGLEQDKILDELMTIEEIKDQWDSKDVEEKIHRIMEAYEPASTT